MWQNILILKDLWENTSASFASSIILAILFFGIFPIVNLIFLKFESYFIHEAIILSNVRFARWKVHFSFYFLPKFCRPVSSTSLKSLQGFHLNAGLRWPGAKLPGWKSGPTIWLTKSHWIPWCLCKVGQ